MTEDMNIAVCMAGQMRTYKKTYGYMKENIFEPLEPDIFIHTERIKGITNRLGESDCQENTVVTRDSIDSLYNPTRLIITDPFSDEELKQYKNVEVPRQLIQAEPEHWKGNIPNFYGIYQCNEMKKNYERDNNFCYDAVIRVRPDLIIRREIPQKVFSELDTLWYGALIDPHNIKVSDKLAISNSSNMDYYSSVWEKLSTYWKDPLGTGEYEINRCGERLLKYHMEQSNINRHFIDLDADTLRSRFYMRKKLRDRYALPNQIRLACKNPTSALKYLYNNIV